MGTPVTRDEAVALLQVAAADLSIKVRRLLNSGGGSIGEADRADLGDRCDNVQKALETVAAAPSVIPSDEVVAVIRALEGKRRVLVPPDHPTADEVLFAKAAAYLRGAGRTDLADRCDKVQKALELLAAGP